MPVSAWSPYAVIDPRRRTSSRIVALLAEEQRYNIDMNERLKLGSEQAVVSVCKWARLDRQTKRGRLRSTKFARLNDEFQDAIVR